MPLNTKNGVLLVKDSKLQADCNCCGGWVCCPDAAALITCTTGLAVQVSLQCGDYQIIEKQENRVCRVNSLDTGIPYSTSTRQVALGSAVAGTHMLTNPTIVASTLLFQHAIPSAAGCPSGVISLTVARNYLQGTVEYPVFWSEAGRAHSQTAQDPPSVQCNTSRPSSIPLCSSFSAYDFGSRPSGFYMPLPACGISLGSLSTTSKLETYLGGFATGLTGDWNPLSGGTYSRAVSGSDGIAITISFVLV